MLSLEDIGVDAGAVQPKKTGRIILDDVDWATVAERHGTRSDTQCRDKWYKQLCPSMVARGGRHHPWAGVMLGLANGKHMKCLARLEAPSSWLVRFLLHCCPRCKY